MKKHTTMAEVAKRVGVSTTVVSYVMNGRAEEMRIPSATRQRVLDACRELNYKRNYAARAMAGNRTQVIGVLFCNGRGDFMADILEGVYDVLRENDYQAALSIVGDNPKIEAADLQVLRDRRVDGVISFPVWCPEGSSHWNEFTESGVPVMFLSIVPSGIQAPSIDLDDFQAGREAAQLAKARGCQKAYLYEFPTGAPCIGVREAGFENECRALGLPLKKIQITEHGEALQEVLKTETEPVGVYVARASEFIPPLRELFGRGTKINPDHVFLSVGSCPEAYFIPNPWFMLPHPARQMGRIAAMRLLHAVKTKEHILGKIVLPHNWISNNAGHSTLSSPECPVNLSTVKQTLITT